MRRAARVVIVVGVIGWIAGSGGGAAWAKRPEHPVDLARFAKDYEAHKADLKLARDCVEAFRVEKDDGASMEDLPKGQSLTTYQVCSTKLRDAVTRFVRSAPSDAFAIKEAITTPVGMMLWLAWTLVDARLAAEDLLLTADPHFRWVLVNDGTEAEPTIPANIAAEQLKQVKDAVAAGRAEVKALAGDELFESLALQDSSGKAWLSDVQTALNDQGISSHAYLFDDVLGANKMFAHDHFSAWVQAILPLGVKLKATDVGGAIVQVKRIDDLETVCTKQQATGYWNLRITADAKLQASAVKKCVETGKVRSSYWPGPFVVSKAVADFLRAQGGAGKRIALNCGRGESTVKAASAVAKASHPDGLVIKPGVDPTAVMAQLPNKWVTPNRIDDAEVRLCVPAQVYVSAGAPDAQSNPPPDKLGKLVMFYGVDLTK